MEDTIFTKIIKNEIPTPRIYEDEHCIVIPDKFPTTEGQVLVITKVQEPYIFNLDPAIYTHIFKVAKKVSQALDTTYNTTRTCLVVEGFEVPHVHIKLYPVTNTHLDIQGGSEISDKESQVVAQKIKENL